MRIVDAETFLKLPSGTVYALYKPYCFDEQLRIKAQTWHPDFVYTTLIGAIESEGGGDCLRQFERAECGESIPMDFDGYGRDGSMDMTRKYAIYEKEDIENLIDRLQQTLET